MCKSILIANTGGWRGASCVADGMSSAEEFLFEVCATVSDPEVRCDMNCIQNFEPNNVF